MPQFRSGPGVAWLAAVLLIQAASCPPAQADGPAQADALFLGANILTFDPGYPRVEAVAIVGERIAAVGDRESVAGLVGPSTRVVQLGDRALLPGFIDAHSHLSAEARLVDWADLSPPPVGPVASIVELQAALRTWLDAHGPAPGAWVAGFGYDDSLLVNGRHPDRRDLDRVTTEYPLFVIHVSGHLAVANSRALEVAGISAATPDPPGGTIRRLPGSNEPSGVLEESAAFALYARLKPAVGQAAIDHLREAQAVYARNGITTVQDGAATPAEVAALRAAAAQGALFLDVVAYNLWNPAAGPFPEDAAYGRYEGRLKIGGVKLILDGSPQGKTAYLSEPYAVPPPGKAADYAGYPAMPQEVVDRAVGEALARHTQLLAHANGDAAAQMLIDAVDKSGQDALQEDTRVVMIHAQTVRDEQLDRMSTLGIIPSFFSAHTFFWGDWHRESVLGPVRADRISPVRSALNRGMPFTLHNDSPVVPPDVIRLLWATVNRRTRSGDILGPAQRVSIVEALRGVSVNAARQYFEEDRKGSITPGKLADLVVLSADPRAVPPESLLSLEVIETVSHGKTVYRATASD
jgi:predicted amidohydrolase YtcJ